MDAYALMAVVQLSVQTTSLRDNAVPSGARTGQDAEEHQLGEHRLGRRPSGRAHAQEVLLLTPSSLSFTSSTTLGFPYLWDTVA